MRKTVAVFLLSLFCFAVFPAAAETTRFWRQSKFDDFEKGRTEGLALRSDGLILLAPRFRQVADPGATYLWAIALDSKSNLYAGGGSGARVFKIDAAGKSTVFFESKEMEVHALVFDSADNLYVGTSPDGKVYRVRPDGKADVFFEPKTKYIWNLALSRAGDLYIATGDQGQIFRVNKEGQGALFFKTDETHVRSLILDEKGNLIAGTDPNGLVLRISAAGEAFVLYETPKKEVTALATDAKGNIYVGAMGEKVRPAAPPAQPPQPMTVTVTAGPAAAPVTTQVGVPLGVAQQPVPFVPFPTVIGGSEVYRIAPDGYPKRIWTSREELVYGLDFASSAELILATGNRGRIVEVDDDENLFTNLVKSTSAQVTALLRTPSGKVYASTANPGKVYELGPGYETEGSFESQVFDAKLFSEWGRIEWETSGKPAPGTIKLYTRSGNTSQPEKNWSAWSRAYTDARGERIESPSARFVQWRVAMTSSGRDSLNVGSVDVAYLPRNAAPVIEAVVVQAPGVRVQGIAVQPPQQQQPVQLNYPQAQIAGQPMPPQPPPQPRFEVPPQGMQAKGYQSVIWSARDENDDDLLFAVYYRAEGEKNWKLLKDKLREKFHTWDAATLPDGAYYIKVTATDAPSNPPELALAAERESDRFEVDNTPPRIDNLAAEKSAKQRGAYIVRFEAHDTFSPIQKADYSVDAGDWLTLYPVTRTTDSPDEKYEWTIQDLGKGEHTIVVRLYDKFDNVALGRLMLTVD